MKFWFALELRSRPLVRRCAVLITEWFWAFVLYELVCLGCLHFWPRTRLPFAIAMPSILLATLAAGNGCAKLVTAINELRRSVHMQYYTLIHTRFSMSSLCAEAHYGWTRPQIKIRAKNLHGWLNAVWEKWIKASSVRCLIYSTGNTAVMVWCPVFYLFDAS